MANSWGGGAAAYDLNGNGSVLDDPRELYTYDEQWRVVAIHRQGPANQLEVNAPRPPAQLYQRFVYHQDGLPAQGVSTGVIDRVVLRQRDADDNPDTGPDGLEETLYYIQNSRGDVMQVIKPIAGPSDEWWNDDRGGYAVESVRYSLYGVPTAIASADINRDGVVDERDVSLFVNGWVQGEIDRRLDVNNNGRLETGPPNDPATGLPISNWDDDDLSLFTREMWDHFYWRYLNGQNPDDGLPLFDGTGAGRGKLSREDIDNRIGAAGMWWDPHLGIYHVRHRAYDPRLGRFLQPDPIGVAGGWNVFEYVGGDPANYIDPMGLNKAKPDSYVWDPVRGAYIWPAFSPGKQIELKNRCITGPKSCGSSIALFGDANQDKAAREAHKEYVNSQNEDLRETGQALVDSVVTTAQLVPGPGVEDVIFAGVARLFSVASAAKKADAAIGAADAVADGTKAVTRAASALKLPKALEETLKGLNVKIVQGSKAAQLPQDVKVAGKAAPDAKKLDRPIALSGTQNDLKDKIVAQLNDAKAQDIRVNQRQLGADGTQAGINRPDIQFTVDGQRYHIEIDAPSSPRGGPHADRIGSNDPTAITILIECP